MKRKIVKPAIQFQVIGHVIPINDSVAYGGVRLTNLSAKENKTDSALLVFSWFEI
jgi:hypothetical protein